MHPVYGVNCLRYGSDYTSYKCLISKCTWTDARLICNIKWWKYSVIQNKVCFHTVHTCLLVISLQGEFHIQASLIKRNSLVNLPNEWKLCLHESVIKSDIIKLKHKYFSRKYEPINPSCDQMFCLFSSQTLSVMN